MSYQQLRDVLKNPESLDELPQMLTYTSTYKKQLDGQIYQHINEYNGEIDVDSDVRGLISQFKAIKTRTDNTRTAVEDITGSIQEYDRCKKNLVQSMTILKRLQMLIKANDSLKDVISTHIYKQIYEYFSVAKDLLSFFKPYKSIDMINQINLDVSKTQNKLVDDIFIDFEELSIKKQSEYELLYACLILESIDEKYKHKLLNWFYNFQLNEIKSIFDGEAGSLENLNRRFMYFQNVLKGVQNVYLKEFPEDWKVDFEISKIFCSYTKQDLSELLNNSVDPKLLLDSLVTTLDFEKYLNGIFKTEDFNRFILKVFEPYISIWIREQEKTIHSKFLEFLSIPKVPQEFASIQGESDLLTLLKVNNVPNISNSSIELFKLFQKVMAKLLKLTNGEAMLELSKVFSRAMQQYNDRILTPVLPLDDSHLNGIEPIIYLTMLINTADYVISNMNDLQGKFTSIMDPRIKGKVNFDHVKETYLQLINKTTGFLLLKVSYDLKFSWREFLNNNWKNMDSIKDVSTYMKDIINSLVNNVKFILPLIIRDSYLKNFCNKLVEMIIIEFLNHLRQIRPFSLLNIEQLETDLAALKSKAVRFTLFSNPNYDFSKEDPPSNLFTKFVNGQFNKAETVLRLLSSPTLPVDSLVKNYINLIGDKSLSNFVKLLKLKSIERPQHSKYIEYFKLQWESYDLIEESSILSSLQDEIDAEDRITEQLPKRISTPEMKSPKILSSNIKLNNLRDFAISGENRLNENFKTFGKFFRKDHTNE